MEITGVREAYDALIENDSTENFAGLIESIIDGADSEKYTDGEVLDIIADICGSATGEWSKSIKFILESWELIKDPV